MAINIIAFTKTGGELGAQLKSKFVMEGVECEGYLYDHYIHSEMIPFHNTNEVVKNSFLKKNAIVFICATGIAVRMIAPYIREKDVDSPVVVMDDGGKFAISLLSGHLGGANKLALQCADKCKAIPVVTTATDIHKKIAVDVWAKENGFLIEDIKKIKVISSAVLDGKKIPIWFDKEWLNFKKLPEELIYDDKICIEKEAGIVISPYINIEDKLKNRNDSQLLVALENSDRILHLIPRQLIVGIGCKKNTSYEKIKKYLKQVFNENNLNIKAIKEICSIDLKANEKGLLKLSAEMEIPFVTFTSSQLKHVEGEFSESEFVKKTTGVGNVCERSAMAGLYEKRKLIVRKSIQDGVTIAVAIECIQFDS